MSRVNAVAKQERLLSLSLQRTSSAADRGRNSYRSFTFSHRHRFQVEESRVEPKSKLSERLRKKTPYSIHIALGDRNLNETIESAFWEQKRKNKETRARAETRDLLPSSNERTS